MNLRFNVEAYHNSFLWRFHHGSGEVVPIVSEKPDRSWHAAPSRVAELFAAMRTGGDAFLEQIPWFNGGLFDDAPPLSMDYGDLGILRLAATCNWAAIEPSILGTVFERSLDPNKRAQIGAHYTSKEDILLVINPVIIDPLRAQWLQLKQRIESQLASVAATVTERPSTVHSEGSSLAQAATNPSPTTTPKSKMNDEKSKITSPFPAIHQQLATFLAQLSSLKILDPACGSGNFLYVAIQQLLYLEKEIITFAVQPPISLKLTPRVRPTQLLGIEINRYAAELAQVSIWIGFLQWMRANGYTDTDIPILNKLQTIQNRDAILKDSDPTKATIPPWPDADFIVGNPPFLGSTKFKEKGISDEYKSAIESLYNIRGKSDLCCYWFEYARRRLEAKPSIRVGLLGNTTMRFGVARDVLDRIKEHGDIFHGWSNREWVNEGAHVRTTIVCFDDGSESIKSLDDVRVQTINADMTASVDVTQATKLDENAALSFEGDQKGGPFDTDWREARRLIAQPNPIARNNAAVLIPRLNANDLTKRWEGGWAIDFGVDCDEELAAKFAAPFEYLKNAIKFEREIAREKKKPKPPLRKKWWLHKCARPELRKAISKLDRFLVTPRVATHRFFRWVPKGHLPDSRLFTFGRDDDYLFGALSSTIHEVWSLAKAPPHGEGNDPTYSATATFETFPLPWSPGKEDTKHPTYKRIAAAAKELDALRENWLNPPEWLEATGRIVDSMDQFTDCPPEARPLLRHSALMAMAAEGKEWRKRTLTNLYNQRPTWLQLAHEKLDRATLAAYQDIDPTGNWSEDWATLYSETGAGTPLPPTHPRAAERSEVDQKILTNLLRLNHLRAANK